MELEDPGNYTMRKFITQDADDSEFILKTLNDM